MRQENSPFRPALRKPADDSVLAGDPAADNFLAGSDGLSGRVTIDGSIQGATGGQPIASAADNNPSDSSDDIFEALSQQADASPAPVTTTPEKVGATGKKPAKKLHMPKFGRKKAAASKTKSAITAAADAADSASPVSPTVSDGNTAAATATKPADKQVTISALTIIFFVLFIISTVCAVYFGIQNNKNASQLSDAQAQVQELNTKNNETANSTNKQNTNFDALQDKITALTKESSDKQKTIDQLNKDKTDLNNKVNTLNGQVTTLQTKVNTDTETTKNINSLITTLCTKDDFKSSAACVAASSSNSQTQANQTQQQSNPATQTR